MTRNYCRVLFKLSECLQPVLLILVVADVLTEALSAAINEGTHVPNGITHLLAPMSTSTQKVTYRRLGRSGLQVSVPIVRLRTSLDTVNFKQT